MPRTPKTRNLIVATVLAAALVLAPTALAGPAYGPADALGSVYAWLHGMWDSIVSITAVRGESSGPKVIPNGPSDEFGPFVIPNGSKDQFGPLIGPNGLQSQAEDEFGGFIVPNGNPEALDGQEEDGSPDDEIGPLIIPNG